MKKVSVVIPCRNEKDFIEACIRSVTEAEYPEEQLEIIVCDGMSDDGTSAILEDLRLRIPIMQVIKNEKMITPVARNLGVKKATGDYILIFDAHAEMAADYIMKNVAIPDSHPEVWCSGGLWNHCYQSTLAKSIAWAMSSAFGVGNAAFRTGQGSGYTDTVGMPLYRKEVFDTIGLFDEALIRNQDDEFNYRLIKAGGRIWLTTGTRVNYFVRPSWGKLFRQYYQYGYWKVYVNRKHRTVTTLRQLVPLFFVLFLAGAAVQSLLFWNISNFSLFVLFLYLTLSLASAMKLSSRPMEILQIMISFFILHFSYGLGYAVGILHFLLAGRKPRGR